MIDLPNPFTESVVGPADRQTVAAASPNAPSAAAVTPSSSLEVATTAPGMAHSNSDPLDIPDFLRRVRIKPEGAAAVILNETRNIQETQS